MSHNCYLCGGTDAELNVDEVFCHKCIGAIRHFKGIGIRVGMLDHDAVLLDCLTRAGEVEKLLAENYRLKDELFNLLDDIERLRRGATALNKLCGREPVDDV